MGRRRLRRQYAKTLRQTTRRSPKVSHSTPTWYRPTSIRSIVRTTPKTTRRSQDRRRDHPQTRHRHPRGCRRRRQGATGRWTPTM